MRVSDRPAAPRTSTPRASTTRAPHAPTTRIDPHPGTPAAEDNASRD
ncbi:unnamed protein product [[Actinomadura] parvosata subsp. kistnae]|nr:unnamed protein product [Actinomadura parvosata subsp. kistnae]